MHAVLITFDSEIPVGDLEAPFTDYAHALRSIPGLLSKAWIHDADQNTLGGFHLFESATAAVDYLESDLVAGLQATDGFDNFDVRHFDVLSGYSAVTGVGDLVPLAGR
ncbi:MAG: YdhR family protein [Actinomycetota bacterium]